MTEAEMVFDCYNKLKKNRGFREIVLEVPYMSRCIDMILVENDYKIVSIEFKIKNWRKALEQAKDHNLGADKSYVCIPKTQKEVSQKLTKELKKHGIGLFLYNCSKDYPFEEIVSPELCDYKWEPWVTSLKNLINKISKKTVFELTEVT